VSSQAAVTARPSSPGVSTSGQACTHVCTRHGAPTPAIWPALHTRWARELAHDVAWARNGLWRRRTTHFCGWSDRVTGSRRTTSSWGRPRCQTAPRLGDRVENVHMPFLTQPMALAASAPSAWLCAPSALPIRHCTSPCRGRIMTADPSGFFVPGPSQAERRRAGVGWW
jgi:hypothetical protein